MHLDGPTDVMTHPTRENQLAAMMPDSSGLRNHHPFFSPTRKDNGPQCQTRRGQRRNTARRAESKATQRRNKRGPRTADRLAG